MVCYKPMHGWLAKGAVAAGNRSFTMSRKNAYIDRPMSVPCGSCIGCRLDRSRNWAIRCMHEASLYQDNVFITLTYAPKYVPADGSLDLTHWQKFMKRLRKRFGRGIRFYMCGEYGEKLQRPHYHALLFNFDFPDKEYFSSSNGHKLFTSKILDEIWGMGHCLIGSVTFESAAYVARYVMKKQFGRSAARYYCDPDGVLRTPEFNTMSRRPGIGADWFKKYQSDVFPHDRVIKDGFPLKPPRYYDLALKKTDPEKYENVKDKRVLNALKNAGNSTPDRLAVREQVKLAQLNRLKRSFERE